MKTPAVRPVRCAIYTRVSTDHGLNQEFNSLDAQYDAASAYIKSQAHAGCTLIPSRWTFRWVPRFVLPGSGCSTISAPGSLVASWSTRSLASRDRRPTLPSRPECSQPEV